MAFEWGQTIERRTSGMPFLVYTPRRTQVAQLLQDGGRWADRTHLVQGERRVTFAEMFREVERVAGILHEQGLRPGDRMLLLAPNSIEWVVAMWAGFRLGAVVSLGNSWWSAADIAYALDLLRPAVVVADSPRLTLLPSGTAGIDVSTLALGGTGPTAQPPAVPVGHEDDPAVIIFTAGTTGHPKAVVLAHRSVLANLHNLLAVSHRLPHQVGPDRPPGVSLQSGPLFHIGGFQSLMLALLGGNTIVFLKGRYDPGEVLELIEREHVTIWGAIPTMASRVLADPAVAYRDLSSVRSISMGGTPVPPHLMERLRQAFPNAKRGLSTIYGMTETGGTVASASGAVMAAHPTTAGKPLPVAELRIDGPGAAGDGEIVVRTPGQLLGYWGQAQSEIVDDDGFVHTGDLGRIEDGLLYVTGRIKDLIIRGGENIAPAHVEAALLKHPAVVNVAVIGRPDEDLGERVAAMVQLAEGESVTAAELAAFVAPVLAKFELPADWCLRTDPVPVTDAGKTDKRAIAAAWPSE
jgi:long-chain acyl-CoA synthetase